MFMRNDRRRSFTLDLLLLKKICLPVEPDLTWKRRSPGPALLRGAIGYAVGTSESQENVSNPLHVGILFVLDRTEVLTRLVSRILRRRRAYTFRSARKLLAALWASKLWLPAMILGQCMIFCTDTREAFGNQILKKSFHVRFQRVWNTRSRGSGCKTLNAAAEKLLCAAVICLFPIVTSTTYTIGKVKKFLKHFSMASTIVRFRVTRFASAICSCSDDISQYMDLLKAHYCSQISSNLQADDLGHSQFQKVPAQQCPRILNCRISQRISWYLQRRLHLYFHRCPDLSHHFASLSK